MFDDFLNPPGDGKKDEKMHDVSVTISTSIKASSKSEAEMLLKRKLKNYIESDSGFSVGGNVKV